MLSHKLSISLPMSLCNFVENYLSTHHCKSRSEVIAKALELLQEKELEACYRAAAGEYDPSFEVCDADGLENETW